MHMRPTRSRFPLFSILDAEEVALLLPALPLAHPRAILRTQVGIVKAYRVCREVSNTFFFFWFLAQKKETDVHTRNGSCPRAGPLVFADAPAGRGTFDDYGYLIGTRQELTGGETTISTLGP